MLNLARQEIQAIFLDRDGVINRERADYVKGWQEFEFLPGAQAALRQLAATSWPILVVTNQSVIGRQIVSAHDVDAIHATLRRELAQTGGRIDHFFVCPHHPDAGCECRKPKPGLLLEAARMYHLALARCVFIGDSSTDYAAARAAGCRAILVDSGRQDLSVMRRTCSNLLILPDLLSAVTWLLAEASTTRDRTQPWMLPENTSTQG